MTHGRHLILSLAAAMALGSPALAAEGDEPMPEGETPVWAKLPKPRGYIRTEMRYHDPHLDRVYNPRADAWVATGSPYLSFGLIPWARHDGYVEANTEVKFAPNYYFTAYADLSLIYSTLGPATTVFEDVAAYIGAATGEDIPLDLTQLPQTRLIKRAQGRLQINELYVNGYIGDHVLLLAGKRRTYWGSSFTWTPLDFTNPPRNALEPTLVREGAWMALTDVTFDRFSISGLYAPFEMENLHGLPTTWSFSRATYAARVYANPFYQDVNLVYILNDDVYPNIARHRMGFSYSGYPVGSIELHAEGTLQLGRTTYLVQRRSPTTDIPELEAPYRVGQYDLEDGRLYGDFLIGTRYNFVDNSMLLVEYYAHSGGYDFDEYELFREYTAYLEQLIPEAASTLGPVLSAAGGGSVPEELQDDVDTAVESWSSLLSNSPFIYQDVFLRRHYLSVAYQMDWLNDKWSPGVNSVVSLEDGMVILYPQVQYRMNDALLMQAGGMAAFGPKGSQAELLPDRFALNIRMTARF